MQRYTNFIASTTATNSTLTVLSNASCVVYIAGTLGAATLYSDNGVTPLANPFLSSATGRIDFYAANGRYDVVVSKVGYLSVTISDIELDDLLASSGSNSVGYLPAGTGAVATTVQTKLRESVSVKDFGAVGDGAANDTAAVTAASAYPKTYAPAGTYSTTFVNVNSVPGSFFGIGQIRDASSRKLAPWFANASAAPASLGTINSLLTAFNGDLSKCQLPIGQVIQGATTLTQPATGYVYTPETSPHFTYLYNSSGWNQGTADNVGRTAAVAYLTKVDNYGQGDVVAYNAQAFVTGARAGATSFLANPAAVLFNGGCTAGAAGVLLGPSEYVLTDAGYDVACVGFAMSMQRTNNTGALDCFWAGYRSQSKGTQAIDHAFGVSGAHYIGIDMGIGTISGSAMTMTAGTKIHFNSVAADYRKTSSLGNTWINYDSTNSEFQISNASATQFAVGNAATAVNYLKAFGAATGAVPQLRGTGSDTNISVGISSKGTGNQFFWSNTGGALQFSINGNQTSAVNYLEVAGFGAGFSPTITAKGADANIDVALISKGTGVIQYGTYTAGVVAQAGYITIKDSGGTTRRLLVG